MLNADRGQTWTPVDISVAVVRQRLRLASVSPRLLDVYAEDGLTLEQLMAFSVNGDHARQEQVFGQLAHAYSREPYALRHTTHAHRGAVRASDKRAQFIGETYEAAGGAVIRDLFQGDAGGWLTDVALVDRLVAERLEGEAKAAFSSTPSQTKSYGLVKSKVSFFTRLCMEKSLAPHGRVF